MQEATTSELQSLDISIAGTFTLDPIREVLQDWCRRIDVDTRVHLANYNPPFQIFKLYEEQL